jgi:hypothetical protein
MRGSFRFSEAPARVEWSRRVSFGLIEDRPVKQEIYFYLLKEHPCRRQLPIEFESEQPNASIRKLGAKY